VALGIPEIEVHGLPHVDIDSCKHGLHLIFEMLKQPEAIVSISDLGERKFDDPLELLPFFEGVEQLVCLISPQAVL